MSKKTHPHKRSHARKAAKRQEIDRFIAGYRPRAGIAGLVIASILFATAALAYWQAEDEAVALAPVRIKAVDKSPVKDASTLSEKELADIPPEAFHLQPREAAGYNAHGGGLPPGALPPGVVLPGLMQGERTTAQGYGMNDGVRQQFTSKERDNETGLDYFGARYYSSAQGRFTSVDPRNAGADPKNPQSWNGYSYALNSPLRFIDPDGQSPQDRFEIEQRRDEKEFAAGKISKEEFLARARARGAGAVAGVAALALIRTLPQVATAILLWAARNPDQVEQIALDISQASSGSPAAGPPGVLTIKAATRLTATEISTGARLAKQTGVGLSESVFVGEEFVNTAGKTYDAMGGTQAFKHFGNGADFFNSIVHHVNKSVDYVALDIKGASKSQINAIQKYISGLTKEQQAKIIYVR